MLPCDRFSTLLTANSSHGHLAHFIAGNGDGTTGASKSPNDGCREAFGGKETDIMEHIKGGGTILSAQRKDDGTTGVVANEGSQIVHDSVEADPTFG